MTSTTRPMPNAMTGCVRTRWRTVRVAGRVVGVLREWGPFDELCLVRIVDGERHQLRRPAAWSLGAQALEVARAAGVTKVVIVDTRSRLVWWSYLADFERRGIGVDYGFGQQIALALDEWSRRPLRPEEVAALLGRSAR